MEFDKAIAGLEQLRIKEILLALAEPFDPEEIYWKPQAVKGERAIAAAYADPRAYSDRLNDVLGPDKWSCSYEVSTISPIAGVMANEKDYKNKYLFKGKVLVVATLSLWGVGQNSGTGESDAVDDNAITSAEAQAFKRAAVRFGLGRYLYDLAKNVWCPYDSTTRKITQPPQLPDWALPQRKCDDCSQIIAPVVHGDKTFSVTEIIAQSRRKYQKQLCGSCQKARKHGTELARAV